MEKALTDKMKNDTLFCLKVPKSYMECEFSKLGTSGAQFRVLSMKTLTCSTESTREGVSVLIRDGSDE